MGSEPKQIACNMILKSIVNNPDVRFMLGVGAKPHKAISIHVKTPYMLRMALTGRFTICALESLDLQLINTHRPGKDWILHIQVGVGECAHYAIALPFDKDESVSFK